MIMIFFYTTYSNRLGLVAQLAEHWTSIPKVAGSIPIFHRGQTNFSACPLWIYTHSNIKNIIFTWVHNIKTHTKKYHNYYQRHPQGLSSWRASNLVPQACDPREGTRGSGIIRCREPGILAKTGLRIHFNGQSDSSLNRIIPEPHVPSQGSQARGTRLASELRKTLGTSLDHWSDWTIGKRQSNRQYYIH
jgi:hypothetical protein